MEIIKVKGNYKNTTLLRIAKNYTIDIINKDTNKVNFNDYGAWFANEVVEDMSKLVYWLVDLKGEIKLAKSCEDKERIKMLRAGEFNYIVEFKNKRLDAVKLVAVV